MRRATCKPRLAKYHADVDVAFRGWNGAWLDPGFKAWNIENAVGRWRVPALLIQGVDDQYGTLKQIRAIEARSPAPVKSLILEALPSLAADRSAAGDARCDRGVLRRPHPPEQPNSSKPGQIRPSQLLGFAWFYSSQSKVFNELRRFQIRNFSPLRISVFRTAWAWKPAIGKSNLPPILAGLAVIGSVGGFAPIQTGPSEKLNHGLGRLARKCRLPQTRFSSALNRGQRGAPLLSAAGRPARGRYGFTHLPLAFDDLTAASMKARPLTPSSMVGKCTALGGFLPTRAALMASATSE